MVNITLCGGRITIDPPQHLLMIEVTRATDNAKLTILHESGHQSEGSFKLVSRWPVSSPENSSTLEESQYDLAAPIPKIYDLAILPAIGEVNIDLLPAQYRIVAPETTPLLRFETGETYSVFILSERMVEKRVVAD